MNVRMIRMAANAAPEGQRPGDKPAQGNALGLQNQNVSALKGRDKFGRLTLRSPFRARSPWGTIPRALPGLAWIAPLVPLCGMRR